MLVNILYIIAGFGLLLWGADRFVTGSAATARNLGVSPLIIGLTIVGFGTSAPEILISGMAAWNGNPSLAIGNAIGSNITNIALVLGTSALIMPLAVRSEILQREYPILFAIMLGALWLLSDGELSRMDGAILIVGLLLMLYGITSIGIRSHREHLLNNQDLMEQEFEAEIPSTMSTTTALMWLLLGLITLLAGARLLVDGSVSIAQALGVSDLLIGLTIVAIGTSLPELAASVMSVLRNEHDLAIGNVIGSNMFNLLAVLGLPGLIHPGAIPSMVLVRDYPVMIGLTLAMFFMAYGFRGPGRIRRSEGAILLLGFAGYQVLLYFSEVAPSPV